jgi:MFS family permease
VRLLVGLYTGQTLIAGTLSVLVAVTALELFHKGGSTVGLLYAAIGVGGLVGGTVALALAQRGRLATDFGLGLALFGAPFALIGAVPHYAAALFALGLLGVGNSLVDISAVTLLQRIVPDEVLGRVLGVLQGLMLGSIGVGALVAPLLIHAFHPRATLVIVGAVLPVLTAVGWRRLLSIDAAAPEPPAVALLRGVDILAPLPLSTLEQLASTLAEVHMPAGSLVIRQGEPGDRFYIVEDGVVEIEGNFFGPGSSFGEIALLRDVPRTATVTAHTDLILQALERAEFLAAVTGNEPSNAAGEAVIARRLGELRGDLTTEREAT